MYIVLKCAELVFLHPELPQEPTWQIAAGVSEWSYQNSQTQSLSAVKSSLPQSGRFYMWSWQPPNYYLVLTGLEPYQLVWPAMGFLIILLSYRGILSSLGKWHLRAWWASWPASRLWGSAHSIWCLGSRRVPLMGKSPWFAHRLCWWSAAGTMQQNKTQTWGSCGCALEVWFGCPSSAARGSLCHRYLLLGCISLSFHGAVLENSYLRSRWFPQQPWFSKVIPFYRISVELFSQPLGYPIHDHDDSSVLHCTN